MNLTLDEFERRAFIGNDQAVLAALQRSEETLLDGVPTEAEREVERAEAEAWEGLAEKLGALVCTLSENMADANKAQRRAAAARMSDLSRRFGGFIDPRRYVAGGHVDSINALAADVDRMADDVHTALNA